MSDLTQIATGILPASGYKAGTVYGIVPPNDNTTGLLDTAFDFTSTRNGVANRTNENGLLEEMANDVCRVDYSDGGCPSLLLEPASTNLFLNSRVPVTQTIAVAIGSAYTISIGGSGSVDLTDALVGSSTEGNDFTGTTTTTSLTCTIIGSVDWVQVELGAYSTTIIDTLGTSVTRTQDNLVQTTPNSDMYNSEEGTLSVKMAALGDDGTIRMIGLGDGTAANRINIYYDANVGRITCTVRVGDVTVYTTYHDIGNVTVMTNFTVTWKANEYKFYVDGVNVDGQLSGITYASGVLNQFTFTSRGTSFPFFGKCENVTVYPRVLTQEEIEQIS